MPLFYAGLALITVGFFAALIIVVHAFRISVSQGFLCLFVPFYILYYAFAHFEHRWRWLLILCLIGGIGGGIGLTELGAMHALEELSSDRGRGSIAP